jgi:uncharacterized protein (TIGR04255 family)
MSTQRAIFKKPPVIEVGISVQFPNSLEVADQRAKFYALIRAEFPQVVIPEQSKCAFDFGDYSLYSENLAERLEIGMNYFRFATTSYLDFARFRTMFLSALGIFRTTYGIPSFSNFFYYYNNLLPLVDQTKFNDLFTLQMHLPGNKENTLLAGQGTLLFQEADGHLAVEFKPEWKELQVVKYGFNLRFGVLKQVSFVEGADELTPLVEASHMHIENCFFSLLQPKYIEFLAAL